MINAALSLFFFLIWNFPFMFSPSFPFVGVLALTNKQLPALITLLKKVHTEIHTHTRTHTIFKSTLNATEYK